MIQTIGLTYSRQGLKELLSAGTVQLMPAELLTHWRSIMIRKTGLFIFLFLCFVGVITFFLLRPSPQLMDSTALQSEQARQPSFVGPVTKTLSQPDEAWANWVDAQIDLTIEEVFKHFRKELPYEGPPEEAMNVEDLKRQLRKVFEEKATEFKKKGEEPPPLRLYEEEFSAPEGPKPHNGPQTVDALLTSFEDMAANPMVDGRYPQAEWVAMLLEKGVTIGHFGDYSRYLTIRGNLISLENRPGEWTSGRYGISPTEDWETYKSAYIDRKIWENQQIINAQKSDPTIDGGIFRGPDAKTFLPTGGGRYYVKRNISEDGTISVSAHGGYMSPEERFDLFVNGIEPRGYQIIYLDDKDNVLSEPPPVISAEAFQEHVQDDILSPTFTPEQGLDPVDLFGEVAPQDKDRSTFQREDSPEEIARAARRMAQRAQVELEALGQIFRTDTEWQSFFEQSLIPTAEVPPLKRTEAKLIEQYPERFDKAVNLIHIHGLEEGMHRLKTLDPDVAVHIENWFRAVHIEKKNPSR